MRFDSRQKPPITGEKRIIVSLLDLRLIKDLIEKSQMYYPNNALKSFEEEVGDMIRSFIYDE